MNSTIYCAFKAKTLQRYYFFIEKNQKYLHFSVFLIIFAPEMCQWTLFATPISHLGLTGFDSGLRWYVSTRRLLGSLLNLSQGKINWRKKLRSRCLIEA